MNLLLLGGNSSTTETVMNMLAAIKGWEIIHQKISGQLHPKNIDILPETHLDIIIANLLDLEGSPRKIISMITNRFKEIPLLVLGTYGQTLLIDPLLEAGATGYLQLGSCEEKIRLAVEKVAQHKQYVHTENT